MSVNSLICDYDIASLPTILKRTEKTDVFASWYQKSWEFSYKILVPILLAKATLEENDELVKVVRPQLTKEVEVAYSELLQIIDNLKFLLLVPNVSDNNPLVDDDYWGLPIEYTIYRGKEIHNILNPDDQQDIPIDMEQVRLSLWKGRLELLPPLPSTDTNDAAMLSAPDLPKDDNHTSTPPPSQENIQEQGAHTETISVSNMGYINTMEQFKALPFCLPHYYVEHKLDKGKLGSYVKDVYATYYIDAVCNIIQNKRISHFTGFMYMLYITPCFNWNNIIKDAIDFHTKKSQVRLQTEGASESVQALIRECNEWQDEYRDQLINQKDYEEGKKKLLAILDDKEKEKANKYFRTAKIDFWIFYAKYSKRLFEYLFNVNELSLSPKYDVAKSTAKKDMYTVYCKDVQGGKSGPKYNWKHYLDEFGVFDSTQCGKIKEYKRITNENRKGKPRTKKPKTVFNDNKDGITQPDFDLFSME